VEQGLVQLVSDLQAGEPGASMENIVQFIWEDAARKLTRDE
jgi:hypothetical protein